MLFYYDTLFFVCKCVLFSLVIVVEGAMEALEFLDAVCQYCFIYLCTSLLWLFT
jgi:hypothetical protein